MGIVSNLGARIKAEADRLFSYTAAKVVRAARGVTDTVTEYVSRGSVPPPQRVTELLVRDVLPPLRDGMVGAEMVGRKRALSAANEAGIHIPNPFLKFPLETVKGENITEVARRASDMTAREIQMVALRYEMHLIRKLQDSGNTAEQNLRSMLEFAIRKKYSREQTAQLLRRAFDEGTGLSTRNPYQIETLVRTHTQIAYNAGRWISDQSAEMQSALWGYAYRTMRDDRVRELHADLEGVQLRKDDEFWLSWWPPNGWNCRCVVLPLYNIKGRREWKLILPPPHIETPKDFNFNAGRLFNLSL